MKEYKVRLKETKEHTEDTWTFVFEFIDSERLKFKPGQFVMLSFPDDKLKRAYSIFSSPTQKDLEFGIKKEGDFTQRLFRCKEGEILNCTGPYGMFCFSDEIKNDIVLIAGGVGLTPLMSILRYVVDKKLPNKVTLLYSAKKISDFLCYDELKELSGKGKIKCSFTITKEEDIEGRQGHVGRINEEMIKENVDNLKENVYFICGPKGMVDGVIEILKDLRLPKENIKTERWG